MYEDSLVTSTMQSCGSNVLDVSTQDAVHIVHEATLLN
jgi:hypothetical protein